MKLRIILSLLLFAGILPFASAQQKPVTTGGNTGKARDVLFPTFQKDLADLNKRSAMPATDRAAVSMETKKRLFTNYQPQRVNSLKARAAAPKSKPLPSDSAAVAKPVVAPQPTPIPNQDGGTAPKKN